MDTPARTHSGNLTTRVTTLLARTLPQYLPGVPNAGFRVESLAPQEMRRVCVRWHCGTPTRPIFHGPDLEPKRYQARIAEELTRQGYAVTLIPGRLEVHVADRPATTTGPRYAVVPGAAPLDAAWRVMDRWTRVPAAVADTEAQAAAEAERWERAHVLTDARLATVEGMGRFLERADELLGGGLVWLYREVHDETHGPFGQLVERERIDVLVELANALRNRWQVTGQGRLVTYVVPGPTRKTTWSRSYTVRWVPKSPDPAVGYFPGWERTPAVDTAIRLLTAAGVRPVIFGELVGPGAYQPEQDGFMATALADGIQLDIAGTEDAGQREQATNVLRAAGWSVESDETWPGTWKAFPPATRP